jgi:hypothetical protein
LWVKASIALHQLAEDASRRSRRAESGESFRLQHFEPTSKPATYHPSQQAARRPPRYAPQKCLQNTRHRRTRCRSCAWLPEHHEGVDKRGLQRPIVPLTFSLRTGRAAKSGSRPSLPNAYANTRLQSTGSKERRVEGTWSGTSIPA